MTDNLEERVTEHKLKIYPKSFTAKYNCNKLVYFEEFTDRGKAYIREKQFKKWKREWKIRCIVDMNPSWIDISENWNINFNRTRLRE